MAQLSIHRPSPRRSENSFLVVRVSFYSVHLGTRRRQRRRLAAAARRQPLPLPPRPSLNKGIRMALRAARRLASCSRQGRLLLPSPAPAPAPCNRTEAPAAAFLHSHATSFGAHPCYPSPPQSRFFRSRDPEILVFRQGTSRCAKRKRANWLGTSSAAWPPATTS